MPNEFVVKNGIIVSQGGANITGSVDILNNLSVGGNAIGVYNLAAGIASFSGLVLPGGSSGTAANVDKVAIWTEASGDQRIRGFSYTGTLTLAADYLSGGANIKLHGRSHSTYPSSVLITDKLSVGGILSTHTFAVSGSTRITNGLEVTGSITATGNIQQLPTASAQIYGVNITPTLVYTTGSQTQTALRVAPTFSGSSTFASSQQNIIADFGATSVGTQFSVNDITSGSIYMVNDVSGLPIIEALSDWTVNMYNYPTRVFQKSGSNITISGSLIINRTGTFVLPLTASASPAIGSAYWSGSFLFVYDGTQYRSASFA